MKTLATALVLVLALSACGGGGDQDDGEKTTQPPACIQRPDTCK